jgi:hypothetical protein
MGKIRVLREMSQFLWDQKKYWLIPIVLTLGALGLLLAFAQGSALAPFVYTLF